MIEAPTATWSNRARKGSLSVALWAFGFATSLLLIGMWGRAVTVDSGTVQETAHTVIDADLARDRIYTWFEEGVATAAGGDSEGSRAVAAAVADRPEFDAAVDRIVDEFIAGLFAEPGEDQAVHVERALAPLVPVVVAEADRRDVPVEEEHLASALDAAAVLDLDTGEAAGVAGVVSEARSVLTNVVMVAALALLLTGGVAVALSDRRYLMVRTLATRVVISAMTYALMFRVASWALDPSRGRSPLLGGGSVVLGSNGHVFVIAAAIAALVGSWGGWVAWRRKRAGFVVTTPEPDTDDTRELVAV